MNVVEMLFKKKAWNVPYCVGAVIGTAFTTSQAPKTSILRDPSTSVRRPKPSRICIVLDKIFHGEVAALSSESGEAYVEMSYSGSANAVFFDGTKLCATTTEEHAIADTCFAAILFGLMQKPGSSFDELREVYSKALEEYTATHAVTTETLGLFCDSYYYNVLNSCKTVPLIELTASQISLIEQAVRTSNLKAISPQYAGTYVGQIFSLINYDPVSAVASSTTILSGNIFEDAKAGVYYLDYDWDEKSSSHITEIDFLDSFIPNAAYTKAVKLIQKKTQNVMKRMADGETGRNALKKDYANIILVGKPGTGKTTTAEALSATFGLPLYTARLSKNTEEGEFEGAPKIAEGSFVLKETPFLECFQNGGIVVLEEFNLADPAVMQGALGQAIEHPSVLMKDGVDPIYRHPLCIVIATMNTGTQGAREPNEAFSSRLPYVFSIDDPKEEEFLAILESRSGHSRKECEKVYNCYKDILKYLVDESGSEEMALCVTMRHCFAALDMLDYEDFNEAIYDSMIGALKIRDIALANEVFESVVKTKKR